MAIVGGKLITSVAVAKSKWDGKAIEATKGVFLKYFNPTKEILMKHLIAALLLTSISLPAFAAPGYVANPATLQQMPFNHSEMIRYLLNDSIESATQKHEYNVNIKRKDPQNPGKTIQQEWMVTLLYENRQCSN